jgi:DNA-binding XRE family transcriptional regulator
VNPIHRFVNTPIDFFVPIVHKRFMHLADFMALKALGDKEMAELLGVDRTTIVKLRTKKSQPSMTLGRRIQKLTRGKVTLLDWPEQAREAAE